MVTYVIASKSNQPYLAEVSTHNSNHMISAKCLVNSLRKIAPMSPSGPSSNIKLSGSHFLTL
jgi:hypothetical protein